jgi:hypothetical protein
MRIPPFTKTRWYHRIKAPQAEFQKDARSIHRRLSGLPSLVGEWDTANDHFDQAEALAEGVKSPLLVADVERWRGPMHRWRNAEGDAAQACRHLQQARDLDADLDMSQHVELAAKMLAQSSGHCT